MPEQTNDPMAAKFARTFQAPQQKPQGATTAPAQPAQQDEDSQRGFFGKAWRAVVRGSAEAVNETADTAVDVGKVITKKTGLYKLVNNKEDEAAWLDWYEADEDVTVIPRSVLPAESQGAFKLLEGITKFGVGMIGASKALKTVKVLGGAGAGVTAARNAMAGAASDFAVFDPHEGRLSNMATEWANAGGPKWMNNPVTRFLSADEDDGVIEGRVKNVLEGAVTGLAVDRFIAGVKWLKNLKKVKAGQMTPEAAEAANESLMRQAEEAHADDAAVVTHLDDESGAVVTIRPEDREAVEGIVGLTPSTNGAGEAAENLKVTFKDPQLAEAFAASLNWAVRNKRLPKGAEVTEELVTEVRGAVEAILNGKDVDGWEGFGNGLDHNLPVLNAEAEPEAIIQAFSVVFRDEFVRAANRAREGLGQSNSETITMGEALVRSWNNDQQMKDLVKLAGFTDELAARLMAHRAVHKGYASLVQKHMHALDINPSNAAAALNLRQTMQTFHDVSVLLSQTKAGIARALQSGNIEPDALLPGGMGKAAREAAEQGKPDDFRQTVTDALAELKKARQEYEKAAKQLEKEKGKVAKDRKVKAKQDAAVEGNPDAVTKGTEGVNAAEFSLARAFAKAQAIIDKADKVRENGVPTHTSEQLAAARKARSERILSQASNPAEATAEDNALVALLKSGRNAVEDISKLLDNQERFLDDISNRAKQELDAQKKAGAKRAKEMEPDSPDLMKEYIKSAKVRQKIATMNKTELRALARLYNYTGDPESIIKALRGTLKAREMREAGDATWRDYLVSIRANLLLSGPQTHIVNAFSNAITMVMHPAETWVGAVVTRNKDLRVQMQQHVSALAEWDTIYESMKAGWRAFLNGTSSLDTAMKVEEGLMESIEAATKGGNTTAVLKAIVGVTNWIGGRPLVAMDDFFKNMTYRANVKAQSRRFHMEAGTPPEEFAEAVAADLKAAFDENGGALNPWALEKAQYATFTNPLDGSLKKFQDIANERDTGGFVARMIFPFVRTPINIARHQYQRLPVIGMMQKQMRKDLMSGNPDLVAAAWGKQVVGLMTYTTAAYLVGSRLITGGGPSEKGVRKAWLDAGNQPYSIRVGNMQISYRRWEPYSTAFSLVADAVEAMGEMQDDEKDMVGYAVISAMAASFSSKSFLQGFTETADIISSQDEGRLKKWVGNTLTSYTVPNAFRQLNADPAYREVRGLVDEYRSRVPGISSDMEPRRNLFGQPVLKPPHHVVQKFVPTTIMGKPDPVLAELAELGKAFEMPSRTREGGRIALTDRTKWADRRTPKAHRNQSPYDRWFEIVAEHDLEGKLKQLLASNEWKAAKPGTERYRGGDRWQMASELIRGVYDAAEDQMYTEYPKLAEAIDNERLEKQAAKAGTISGDQRLFQ